MSSGGASEGPKPCQPIAYRTELVFVSPIICRCFQLVLPASSFLGGSFPLGAQRLSLLAAVTNDLGRNAIVARNPRQSFVDCVELLVCVPVIGLCG